MSSYDTHQLVEGWFAEHLPADLFAGTPRVTVDRDEIAVVGPLADDADVSEFRERTRDARIAVARAAEEAFGRKVSWGVAAGDQTTMFTHLAVPVMTRLRMAERHLLDLLVEGGVARSRSDALAWCVALVNQREAEWLGELHDSLAAVRAARAKGPTV